MSVAWTASRSMLSERFRIVVQFSSWERTSKIVELNPMLKMILQTSLSFGFNPRAFADSELVLFSKLKCKLEFKNIAAGYSSIESVLWCANMSNFVPNLKSWVWHHVWELKTLLTPAYNITVHLFVTFHSDYCCFMLLLFPLLRL